MLYFIGGLVVGAASIYAVYRFKVIPKWEAAVTLLERDYQELVAAGKRFGL